MFSLAKLNLCIPYKVGDSFKMKKGAPFLTASEMSDNGVEFRGKLRYDHPFETMCKELGIKHIYTITNRSQTNWKIEAFFKIVKKEFFYSIKFDSMDDVVLNLGNFLLNIINLGGMAD
jgi:transposase InsO family protein